MNFGGMTMAEVKAIKEPRRKPPGHQAAKLKLGFQENVALMP
jgi:hypothetical protein